MSEPSAATFTWWRGLALASIFALGVGSLLGSGGGGGGCALAPGPCPGDFPDEPVPPTIAPAAIAVQVGSPATFSASAPGISSPLWQWQRTSGNGGQATIIPGATSATYVLPAAQLPDNDTLFTVHVSGLFEGHSVALTSAAVRLAVSSMPAVVVEDTEFTSANWSATALATPGANGPTHSEQQVASGGNPGAYRQVSIVMTDGPSKIDVFNEYQGATYDPATQGPVLVIEFTQDCHPMPGALGADPTILLEQAGRRYVAGGPTQCDSNAWSHAVQIPGSFRAGDFVVVDGPSCGVGESCPDFSSAGLPMRFGFANANEALVGINGLSGGFGIDNWKVTIWRP